MPSLTRVMSTGVSIAAILGATMSVLACQPANDTAEPAAELMSFAQMQDEYRQKVASYDNPLPPGVRFPNNVPKPEQPTRYEAGNGVVLADVYWRCAWMRSWLDTKDAARAEAMAWLRRAPETEYMRKHLVQPEGNEVWDRVLGQAELGDHTLLKDYYDSGCEFHRDNQ